MELVFRDFTTDSSNRKALIVVNDNSSSGANPTKNGMDMEMTFPSNGYPKMNLPFILYNSTSNKKWYVWGEQHSGSTCGVLVKYDAIGFNY